MTRFCFLDVGEQSMLIIPSFAVLRGSSGRGMDPIEDTKKTACEREMLNDCARRYRGCGQSLFLPSLRGFFVQM